MRVSFIQRTHLTKLNRRIRKERKMNKHIFHFHSFHFTFLFSSCDSIISTESCSPLLSSLSTISSATPSLFSLTAGGARVQSSTRSSSSPSIVRGARVRRRCLGSPDPIIRTRDPDNDDQGETPHLDGVQAFLKNPCHFQHAHHHLSSLRPIIM